jgi:hypothetical protein
MNGLIVEKLALNNKESSSKILDVSLASDVPNKR